MQVKILLVCLKMSTVVLSLNISFPNFLPYKVCLISPGTDLPGEWALLALGSVPGLLRQILCYVLLAK